MNQFEVIADQISQGQEVGIRHEDAWTYQCGNVLAKQMILPKGSATVSHSHHHDHMTLLAKGTMTVVVGNDRATFVAPAGIAIKAGEHHALIAMTDVVAYCIHDVTELDPENLGEPFKEH